MVFINTPLDVAMARRLLRDSLSDKTKSSEQICQDIKGDLEHYLQKARLPYLVVYKQTQTADLVLDGTRALPDLVKEVLLFLEESVEN